MSGEKATSLTLGTQEELGEGSKETKWVWERWGRRPKVKGRGGGESHLETRHLPLHSALLEHCEGVRLLGGEGHGADAMRRDSLGLLHIGQRVQGTKPCPSRR